MLKIEAISQPYFFDYQDRPMVYQKYKMTRNSYFI